jgi:hypothetical protein
MTYPDTVSIGYNQVEVEVQDHGTLLPVAGASICLTGDSLLLTATTDAQGRAWIPFTLNTPDTLTLLVRRSGIIPREGTIIVRNDAQHVTPLGRGIVTDSDGNLDGRLNPGEHGQIVLTLKNWGNGLAENVTASLSSADTTRVQVLTSVPIPFGTMGAGDSATGGPFLLYVKPSCPVGTVDELNLRISSTDRSWDYIVSFETMGCRLNYVGALINDQGSVHANSRLDPGETAMINISVNNLGEDLAPGVTGVLRSTDTLVTIIDSTGTFGTIAIGASSASTSDFFIVAIDDSCPINYSAPFTLELYTSGGPYPYNVTRSLSIPVGLPLPSDPTGPDLGGYYAYSSDDSLYEQAPVYNWFDIGSLGTLIPRNSNGDFTRTIHLPFTFAYYDSSYDSGRISSDGWIVQQSDAPVR